MSVGISVCAPSTFSVLSVGGVSVEADAAVADLLKQELVFDPDVKCNHHGEDHHHHHEGGCGSHGCGSHSCGH